MPAGAPETRPWTVQGHLLAPLVVAVAIGGCLASRLPADSAAGWALRVAGGCWAVMVAPGALTLLAWRPEGRMDLLAFLGVSLAVSFGLLQVLTFGAVGAHWSPVVSLGLLGAWTLAHLVRAMRARPALNVTFSPELVTLAIATLAVGACLYIVGSPFEEGEERIHVAIVERLIHLPKPAIDNLYFAPKFVYTYPFPGTHYMLALVARLEGIDALFLYHKLRGFWGIGAALLLYGCARGIFGSTRLAAAVLAVSLGLVVNGAFGAVPGFYWAQMAPYSHASDVAMGVLLPAALLLTVEYLRAATARAAFFYFVTALAMTSMLIAVHPREMVQLLVYCGALGLALLLCRGPRAWLGRLATLTAVSALALLVYRLWHASAVSTVDIISAGKKRDLADIFHGTPWLHLMGPPLPLLRNYMPGFGPMFYGWNAVVLLASPVVLALLRGRTLSWLLTASIVIYAFIVWVPLLGLPYIYFTYFEILYSPVRNVVFFIHMLAGAGLYVLATRLARFGYIGGGVAAVAAGGILVAAFRRAEGIFAPRPEGFFILLIALFVASAVVPFSRTPEEHGDLDRPSGPRTVALAILALLTVGLSTVPDSSLLHVSWAASSRTPDALMARYACAPGRTFCAPPPALVAYVRAHVPVNSVFAVDRLEEFQPALVLPQQMVIWPGEGDSLMNPDLHMIHFPAYFTHDARSQEAYQAQPLFNDRENRGERVAFLRDLRATHILVNPRTHAMMTASLARDGDLVNKRYDDGAWALYEVSRNSF